MTAAEQLGPDENAATRRSGVAATVSIAGLVQPRTLKTIAAAKGYTTIIAFIFFLLMGKLL